MSSGRRMSSVSVGSSARRNADENGPLADERQHQKASTTRSIRVAQLERVDEDISLLGGQRRHLRSMMYSGGLQSPLSSPSNFSSDEEIENRRQQGVRRTSAVSFGIEKDTSHAAKQPARLTSTTRRSSLRLPLHNLSPRRRSSHFGSGEYVSTTLNEKKQKKLVALFYWRRKTLETYLSAWKWVTFDAWQLDGTGQRQQQKVTLVRPYTPVPVRPVERRPSHHSTLLRNAHEHQHQSRDALGGNNRSGSVVAASRDRIRSLRDEYRQLKAAERQQAESVADVDGTTTFKERLRIYYRCFEGWCTVVDVARAARLEATERAVKWHSQRSMRRCFRAWAKPFMLLRHSEILQWERASVWGDTFMVRRRFRMWLKWLAWARTLKDWRASLTAKRQVKAIGKWRRWMERTARIRVAEQRLQYRLKRRSFQRIKQLRAQRQRKERATELANDLYNRHTRKHAWSAWKHSVFHGDDAKFREKLITTITYTLAVNKWKRYTARRRASHEKATQADSLLYEALLRRFWKRWTEYVKLVHNKQFQVENASRHKELHDMRKAVRLWIAMRCEAQYERDRDHGAANFYEHRQVQSMFLRWKTHASDLRSTREMQVQRVKRWFVLCFVAWRQHAQRSGQLRILHDTVEVGHQQRLKIKALREWRHQQRLCVAFAIVADARRQNVLQLYLYSWRRIIMQRQQWERSIERSLAKRSHKLKRLLLVAWFGVVMKAQCQSKLIQLFQKKHNRKQLKRCIRAFRIHSSLQQFEARGRQRCMESVWHVWVVYVSDEQQKTNALITADRFYRTQRFAVAVRTWSQNARAWIVARRNAHKALRFLITRVMRTTLNAWHLAGQTQRQHRRLIDQRVRQRQDCLLRKCMRCWKTSARRKVKKRKIHNLLCHHLIHHLQRSSFTRWCEFTARQRLSRQRVLESQRKSLRRLGKITLHAWRIVAFRLHKKRTKTHAVAGHDRRRVLVKTLRAWRVAAAERRRYGSNLSKAVAFHREFLLLWAFYGWQHASLAGQVLKEKTRRAVSAINQRRLHRALSLWKRRQHKHQLSTLQLGRAVHFYRQRRRKQAVVLWHTSSKAHVKARRAIQRADDFANVKRTQRCLYSWILFTSGTRAFKLKLRTVFQTGDDDILRKVFRRWRRYKRSSTLRVRADSWRDHTCLATIWRHWRAHVMFAHKMKANVLVTSRLLQNNTLRATFVRWKNYITIHHQHIETSKRGEAFYVRRCLQRGIWCFRVQLRHARAVELSETFHVKHALRQYWNHWWAGMKCVRQSRKIKADAIAMYQNRTSSKVFTRWKGLVEAKQRVLCVKADEFCCKLMLKHVWRAWKRVNTCRSLVIQATSRHEMREKGVTFKQWRAFVQEQQLIRRHVNAAVAHLDRVMMEKIWERWLQFREIREQVHELDAKARAFYSSRILLTRSLTSWQKFITVRRQKNSLRVEAAVFHSLQLIRKSFDQLQAYAAFRHRRSETISTQAEAVQLARQKRAVSKWHERAAALHKMRHALTRAVGYHKQRKLSESIGILFDNKTERTQRRQDKNRAIAHRRLCLFEVTFTRWKAFITWRHRHKHLLRLFRTNQLGDYFTLWCKYLLRSKRKREQQAKATQGYRQLLERNVFIRWKERCFSWKNKRRAVDWFARRQVREVFTVWSHRVRVLRKMRLMFRFQDAFRTESHFAAWKRRWWHKKQQVARVQDASKWFERHRLVKCFSLWARWLASKRQEKETMRMAVGFQRRFFSRKYLAAWHSVIMWRRRKQQLLLKARQLDTRTRYRRVWEQLQAYRVVKKRLRVVSEEARESLDVLAAQRAVDQWKQRVTNRRERQRLLSLAEQQCSQQLLKRSWFTLRQWFSVQRDKHVLAKRADSHFHRSVSRRQLLAWSAYTSRMRHLRRGLQRFKMHYFRSVADECFSEWKVIVRLKQALRLLKQRVQSSLQRQMLHAWYSYTRRMHESKSMGMKIHQRRRLNLLRQCLTHWEIVATDKSMYATLVRVSMHRHEHRLKERTMEHWKQLQSQRQKIKRWRVHARQRHAVTLREILQSWRSVSCDSGGESVVQ